MLESSAFSNFVDVFASIIRGGWYVEIIVRFFVFFTSRARISHTIWLGCVFISLLLADDIIYKESFDWMHFWAQATGCITPHRISNGMHAFYSTQNVLDVQKRQYSQTPFSGRSVGHTYFYSCSNLFAFIIIVIKISFHRSL